MLWERYQKAAQRDSPLPASVTIGKEGMALGVWIERLYRKKQKSTIITRTVF
jgi:hypothetical protein